MRKGRGAQALVGAAVFLAAFFFGQALVALAEVAQSNEVRVFVRPSVSCFAADSSASQQSLTSFFVGQEVFWKSTVLPAGASYTYVWSGDEELKGTEAALPAKQYRTAGAKKATLAVTPVFEQNALPSGMQFPDLSVSVQNRKY